MKRLSKKEFVKIMDALCLQNEIDNDTAMFLGKAFPNAFEANLLPNNSVLENAIVHLLETLMGNLEKDEYGDTWITYFMWELDFGRMAFCLPVHYNNKKYELSDAGKLYDFIKLVN